MLVLTVCHADRERGGCESDVTSNIQQWFVGSAITCVISWSYKW